MNVDPWILTFSAATVIATVWMGFWSARKSKTAHDFFVAGRSVSVGWNASAISGEYLSAASFMGVAGMVMSSGYDALWYPVCYACGYLFLLLFIAGPLRRFGAYTIPDFAEGRFDSPVFRKIAVVFVLFIGFFYTMPQMKGAGTTLAYIFPGLPYWAGVVLVGAVITLNVALGGMKGITLVQAFQYWAKMFAISVPIFVLMAVYGHYGKQLESQNELPGASQESWESYFVRIADDERPYYLNGVLHVAKLKLGLWNTTASSLADQWTVEQMSAEYANSRAAFGRRIVYVESGIASNAITYPGVSPPTLKQSIQVLGDTLKSNGIVVQEVADRTYKFFSQTNASRLATVSVPEQRENAVRYPLPEKAPADSTWLSPFGPLTTKAAKAAAPKISFSVPLKSEQTSLDALSPGFYSMGRFTASSLGLTATNYSAEQLAKQYVAAVLESEKPSRNVRLNFHKSPTLSSTSIRVSESFNRPPSKMAEALLQLLHTNGITVVRESAIVFKAFPTKEAVIAPIDPKPYSLLYTYSLIIALVCGTAGLPHILVRFYTNPDGTAAKRTTMWVMILIGVFYLFPPVFGVMGRNLLPDLYAGTGAKGTDKVVLELPRILNAHSPTDSLTRSPKAEVSESVGGGVSGKRKIPWGSILSGITCAGAFAAFMSTFSGLLVSMTGALAHDVYGRMLRPKSTPNERMRAFRIAAVIVGGVAILLGMQVEQFQINFMVGQAFAIAAASYFPLLFMSAWWRGMTMKGAATGMLTGGCLALAGITLTSFSDLGWLNLKDFWAANPLARILCEQPAIWTVPLAIALMVIVSKLTAKEVPSDIRMKMLVLHAPEKLGLKQEYIQEHQQGH